MSGCIRICPLAGADRFYELLRPIAPHNLGGWRRVVNSHEKASQENGEEEHSDGNSTVRLHGHPLTGYRLMIGNGAARYFHAPELKTSI